MCTLTTPVHHIEVLDRAIMKDKKKDIRIEKEEVKLLLFSDDRIYIQNIPKTQPTNC